LWSASANCRVASNIATSPIPATTLRISSSAPVEPAKGEDADGKPGQQHQLLAACGQEGPARDLIEPEDRARGAGGENRQAEAERDRTEIGEDQNERQASGAARREEPEGRPVERIRRRREQLRV